MAEDTYRVLFDGKKKVLSELGRQMCAKLGIDPETLIPKRLEVFEQQDGDKDMAKLHFRHY